MDYYSLKMRASQQVGEGDQKHEQHISGAERIVSRDAVEAVCTAMAHRALTHSKGDPDFINIKIEKVSENDIQILKALPVTRIDVNTWQQGLDGAMLYDIATGTRLEPDQQRGVRATYMDALHSSTVDSNKNHFNEAIVLATKVANAPGMVAELCISDDPNYITGYVASKELGYVRIMKMKEMGDENGGKSRRLHRILAEKESACRNRMTPVTQNGLSNIPPSTNTNFRLTNK